MCIRDSRKGGYETPPVFIVVCPNTTVSKLVFEWISGVDVDQSDGSPVARPGFLPLLSNVDDDGRWLAKPRTILIDSAQLERGEAMKDEFKQAVGHEIEQFKLDLRHRNPSVDVENLTDEDLLREVMNTVGKPGRLGEGVRCVAVSYTHLRAHETVLDLVCRLLLEKKKKKYSHSSLSLNTSRVVQ